MAVADSWDWGSKMIELKKPQSGGGLSKLVQAGIGFATGGPVGAAMALASDSPAKKALGLYQTASSIADQIGPSTPNADKIIGAREDVPNAPGLMGRGASASDAISRRMGSLSGDLSPEQHLDAGIAAIDHPDMIGKVHPAIAAALYGAKHFGGPHPTVDKYIQDALGGGIDGN